MENSTTFDPNTIAPLGGIPPTAKPEPITKKPDLKLLDNAPNDVTFVGFFGKIVIGGIIWACISALLFAVLSAIGGMLATGSWTPIGLLGIVLAFIGFIAGMLGNMGLALLYNLFFSKRYHTLGKMFGLIFTSSIIIFVLSIPLYLLFQGGVVMMFTVLGIQILFSFFVTSNLIEQLAQPNYSASSLIGNTFGFVLAIVVYLGIVKGIEGQELGNQTFVFMLLPTVVGYPVILFGLGLRDAIYYKFFERGNNPFYLRSASELSKERQEEELQKKQETESINVEMS